MAAPVVLRPRRDVPAGAASGRARRARAEHALPLERGDRGRQPLQPHAGGARRVPRPARSLLRLRDRRARRPPGHVPRVPCGLHGRLRARRAAAERLIVRICHVTPHLPPDQAANALLPFHLGCWARDAGHQVSYIAHPPRAARDLDAAAAGLPGPVIWIPHRRASGLARLLRLDSARTAADMWQRTSESIATCDVVHIHGNGLLAEMAALLARRHGRPYLLTLYGTEIWHYRPRRPGPDLFTRAYHGAAHVTFYSQALPTRAVELGLARHRSSVVYPPVAPEFVHHDERAQLDARVALGYRQRHLIVNVKRLHPLAGQRYLIEALGEVVRTHPDTRLVICGTGPLLEDLKAVARSNGVEQHVTFAGLLDNATIARINAAADVFVLP